MVAGPVSAWAAATKARHSAVYEVCGKGRCTGAVTVAVTAPFATTATAHAARDNSGTTPATADPSVNTAP